MEIMPAGTKRDSLNWQKFSQHNFSSSSMCMHWINYLPCGIVIPATIWSPHFEELRSPINNQWQTEISTQHLCDWADLVVYHVVPVSLNVTEAPANILTQTSWETPNQNHAVSCSCISVPQKHWYNKHLLLCTINFVLICNTARDK